MMKLPEFEKPLYQTITAVLHNDVQEGIIKYSGQVMKITYSGQLMNGTWRNAGSCPQY
jgi:hypothetical protein